MSANHLDGFIVLLGICGSYIALIIFYLLTKKYLPNIYQAEKTFFSQFSNISIKPNSVFDYIAYLILLSIFALMIWNNFNPTNFKHIDTILYIRDTACNFQMIPPQVFWEQRFFPFAHQEWTLLAPLLWLTDCNAFIPFFLITLQYFITAYLLFYIIPFERLAFRLITVAIIISNASFFTPFGSVIINDRNTLFLIIVFLYCFITFFKTEKPIYLLIAFICANSALYFKEPIFIYFATFAFISFCFHLYQKQFKLSDILSPATLIRKQPMEILLAALSLFFISLWAMLIIIFHSNSSTYGIRDDVAYMHYIINQLQNYPLFALIILMIIGYIIDYKNIQKHQFSLMLFIGGLFYAFAVSNLTSNLLYYYSISEMSIILAGCYYLKNISWQKNLKSQKNIWLVFAILIACFIVFDTIKSPQKLFKDITYYKATQHQIRMLFNNLPLDATKTNKNFYYDNNEETHATRDISDFFLILRNLKPSTHVYLYGFQPCYKRDLPKQTAQLKCIQTDKWQADDYDFTIFWRNQISDEDWQSLQAQYGDNMQKITNFPAYLGDTTRANIYVDLTQI